MENVFCLDVMFSIKLEITARNWKCCGWIDTKYSKFVEDSLWRGMVCFRETISLPYTPSNFLKAVFHKFYLVHSWILCSNYCWLLKVKSNSANVFYFGHGFYSQKTASCIKSKILSRLNYDRFTKQNKTSNYELSLSWLCQLLFFPKNESSKNFIKPSNLLIYFAKFEHLY